MRLPVIKGLLAAIVLVGASAQAAGVVANQTPGASLVLAAAYGTDGFGICDQAQNTEYLFNAGVSAAADCEPPQSASASAWTTLDSFGTDGLSFHGGAAADASLAGAEVFAESQASFVFDVLDPAGTTVRVSRAWYWTGRNLPAEAFSFNMDLRQTSPGCASEVSSEFSCLSWSLFELDTYVLNPPVYSPTGGNEVQTLFLGPGTYILQGGMSLRGRVGPDSIGALGSYDVFMAVVPLPAAAWLMGSALVGLGWLRRKAEPA